MLQIRCEYPQEQIVTERGGLIDSAINKPKTQSNRVVDIFHFTIASHDISIFSSTQLIQSNKVLE